MPRIPPVTTAGLNDISRQRRHREVTDLMLNFQHDDSRIRTSAEVAAGVTPVNYAYEPGDIRRYGPVDVTGTTDASSAINAAIRVGGDVYFPYGKIRWDTVPTITDVASLRLFGEGAGSGPESAARTRLYVKNQVGFTFNVDDSTDLMEMTLQGLEFDGSNGDANPLTNGSTTWLGVIQVSKTTDNGFRLGKFYECHFHGTLANNALLNLGLAYVIEVRGCQISQAPNGYGVVCGGSSNISTSITFSKCYFALLRQAYLFNADCTDATFNDTVFESSCVVGHASFTKVTLNDCYLENIGYDPLSLGRGGITKMSGAIVFSNTLDTLNCDAAFTQLYGTLTFNDLRSSNHVSTLSGLVHGIGQGSSIGADGAFVANGGTNTETTVSVFRAQVLSERSSFVFNVFDPSPSLVSSIGFIRKYSDARLVTDGMAWIGFPAGVRRLAKIRRGRFIYGLGLETTYSAALADQPSGGQNEVNDRVLVTAPGVLGIDEYICTVAGSPGTWTARSIYAEKTVTVTYSASMTIDANTGNVFEITATNGTAFTINSPSNPIAGHRITIRIYNTSGGALGAITWNAAFKMSSWTSPANGFNRSIDFQYSSAGGGVWCQVGQTGVDVPN